MNSPLIVALDTPSMHKALEVIRLTKDKVWGYKIGPQLLYRSNLLEGAVRIRTQGVQTFIDMKFFDIPKTVAEAVTNIRMCSPKMITVSSMAMFKSMSAAVLANNEAWKDDPKNRAWILGVTVLTSIDEEEWARVFTEPLDKIIDKLVDISAYAGADGVVCSGLEVEKIKKKFPGLKAVVPGIRLEAGADDQKRTMSAKEAISRGADYLVVGRPIMQAPNPLEATLEILDSINI